MLNFYATPVSPFAAKVHYFLEEQAIPYNYHVVDLRPEASREVLNEVNPFSKVPAIELNGFKVGESSAILRYLAARYELNTLYPVNLEERAHVDAMHDFGQNHLARHILSLAWNLHWAPKFGQKTDQRSVDEARNFLPPMFARIEREITGRTFLNGSDLTIADIALTPFFAWLKYAELSLSDYPSLQAWTERMTQRPAWKKTAADIDKRIAAVLSR